MTRARILLTKKTEKAFLIAEADGKSRLDESAFRHWMGGAGRREHSW